MGDQAGRALEVPGLWLQQPRGRMECRKCSDEGRKGPPGRFPRRSGEGYGYGGVGKSGESSKGSQPRGDGRCCSDEDDGREGEAADGVAGDRAGDAGASCGELQPSSAQLLEMRQREADQTRAALRGIRPLRTQLKAAIESRDKLMKKHSSVVEGVHSELDGPVAGEAVGVGRARDCVEGQSSTGGAAAREGARGRACGAALCPAQSRSRRHVCGAVGGRVGNSAARLSGRLQRPPRRLWHSPPHRLMEATTMRKGR